MSRPRSRFAGHLKILKSAGLVTDWYAPGNRRVYSVDPVGLAAIRDYVHVLQTVSWPAFQAERPASPSPGEPMTTQTSGNLGDDARSRSAPIEHAFRVFTEGIGTWWNCRPPHPAGRSGRDGVQSQRRVGGHIIGTARHRRQSSARWSRRGPRLRTAPPDGLEVSVWDHQRSCPGSSSPCRPRQGQARSRWTRSTWPYWKPLPTVTHVGPHPHGTSDRHGDGWESMRDRGRAPAGISVPLLAAEAAAVPSRVIQVSFEEIGAFEFEREHGLGSACSAITDAWFPSTPSDELNRTRRTGPRSAFRARRSPR